MLDDTGTPFRMDMLLTVGTVLIAGPRVGVRALLELRALLGREVLTLELELELEVDDELGSAADVGVTRTYPYSVEKVRSCAHWLTVYLPTRAVSVVAQTMVTVGL